MENTGCMILHSDIKGLYFWYQGLDSDICGLLVSNNDILFCLLSMISIVKKKDWYHYDIEQFKARVLHRLHRSQILSKFDLQWYHFDISD